VTDALLNYLKRESRPVVGVSELMEVGKGGGLENKESLKFLCELYDQLKENLNQVLNQRKTDRHFIDQRTRACYELNKNLGIDFISPQYETIIGHEDANGRIVIGPKNDFYAKSGGGKPIAQLPDFLQGHHVTLFGPPDDAKLSINAMNAFYRKTKDEPEIVSELLSTHLSNPKWGADDEDSKTPLRADLVAAGENLTRCFAGDLEYTDPKTQKKYALEKGRLALPIKRFPGLALPCTFLLYRDNPLPLHLYDFALHLFENWHNEQALSFYVPKLENEEEARYIYLMCDTAEAMIQKLHPEYKKGAIRLFVVLENPRAIFRVNEIMDALYPYFAGASLGWHDYLSSAARLFKNDANYRIPVKADPDIVIKYIKASHDLLAQVVGSRGGVKIGGMYGVLPMDSDLFSPSYQIAIKGFIKDVVTELKRNLSGFWVAHPDFIRCALAIVESWKFYQSGDKSKLDTLVTCLLDKKYHKEIREFIHARDLAGLDVNDPLYARSLIVADIKESTFIANNHPDEIRYNVFQSLQYLTDWLSGNGCVALPAEIEGVPVRVMDDLATAERSRWEVWHELHHGRFNLEEFLKIAHEEMIFIRKDLSNSKKIVQVKWNERTEKWYPVAMRLMIELMTSPAPVEFATELLMSFTVDSIRQEADPLLALSKIDPGKLALNSYIERFNYYFLICGNLVFAKTMAQNISVDLALAEKLINNFTLDEVKAAAYFHGDIGENKKTLDEMASNEQALVLNEDNKIKSELADLGFKYLQKFGVKFLISAKNKSGKEIVSALRTRLENTASQELINAKSALWEISLKRLKTQAEQSLHQQIERLRAMHNIGDAAVSVSLPGGSGQLLCFGGATEQTWFQYASLSKTLSSCFAVEYFHNKNISLDTPVDSLLEKTESAFRIKSAEVTLRHLMNHTALNMHYVNGVPTAEKMPNVRELLDPIVVTNVPGTRFQYSGGGFLVLQHLIEALEGKTIVEITKTFFDKLDLKNLSFAPVPAPNMEKMFPAFAAGVLGTATDMSRFLGCLTGAYKSLDGAGPISHNTAIEMLHGADVGSFKFIGAKMGLGVFIAEAGPNRLMLHQGANDGFRSVFVHCFDGPDSGTGFVVLCTGDFNGVLFISEVAQLIFKELNLKGVDTNKFLNKFELLNIPPEEVVNRAYKNLLFDAFEPDLPEVIKQKGPLDPLASKNLAVGGKIVETSNQGFARAENLLSPHLPTFDSELYGRQGKIMDSWESVRHNPNSNDYLIFELKKPSTISQVSLSTKYHLGNHAEAVEIEGLDSQGQWQRIIAKTELNGHAIKFLLSLANKSIFTTIKVSMFPDGGLTRLGLYKDELPEQPKNQIFSEGIPHTNKPLTPQFKGAPRFSSGIEIDIASQAYGGKIISVSNQHYGPASQIISPYPPINMFDGFESARSREADHFEDVIIELGRPAKISRIEIDFTYFKNNNPRELSIEGLSKNGWVVLVTKTNVKAYAGNVVEFKPKNTEEIKQVKVVVFPDGGINRVKVFTRPEKRPEKGPAT